MVSKLVLLRKAARNPSRALLRLILRYRVMRRHEALERRRLFRALSTRWDVDARALRAEYQRSRFAAWYRARSAELRGLGGKLRLGTSDASSAEALYVLVRAARPRVVVETGVLYGGSSAHILAALAANGRGELHSVDLGCAPDEPPHDFLVPPDLRARWNYIMGHARQELPRLLDRLGTIDLFHHDSLHTFEHMTWEFETAARHLSPDGVISSHDVLVADSLRHLFRENAFPAFCRRWGFQFTTVGNAGMAVRPAPVSRPARRSAPTLSPRTA